MNSIPNISSILGQGNVSSLLGQVNAVINNPNNSGTITNLVNRNPAIANANLQSLSSLINSSGNAGSNSLPNNINSVPSPTANSATSILFQTDQNNSTGQQAFNGMTTTNAATDIPSVVAIPNALAKPTFSTGPNDTLAALDVYNITADTPINSIKYLPTTTPSTAITNLIGSKNNVVSLNNIINTTTASINKIGSINPLSLLNSQAGAMTSGIRSLPPGCGNPLTNGIISDLNKLNKLTASMNGNKFNVNTSALACVEATGNLLNKMSKANGCSIIPFGIPDISAELIALSNLLNSALRLGIPGAFSSLICGLSSILSINQLAAKVTPTVIAGSDLPSLVSMAANTSKGYLNSINPGILAAFSKNYTNPLGTTGGSIIGNYGSVNTAYNTIKPDWNTTNTVGNGTIADLTIASNSSPDFKNTLTTGILANSNTNELANDTANNQSLLYAPTFGSNNVLGSLSDSFPEVSFTSNNNLISPLDLAFN